MKNWKIKTNFNVEEAVDEFKKSIKCPDPERCEIESSKEFYLHFLKNNDTLFQSTNKNIINMNSINETSTPTLLSYYVILLGFNFSDLFVIFI